MNNLNFFEKSVKVVDQYGSWKVFQAIVYLGLFLFIIFYVPSVTKLMVENATTESIEIADKSKEKLHAKNIVLRGEMQPQILSTLEVMLHATNSDRAFIIELHNGSNNLNGVPFLHGSVTYEKVKDGVIPIDEEYQNLSLSRFSFPAYIHKSYTFIGSVQELESIDTKLALKLSSDGVKYLAVMTLQNGINEWGWFGVLFDRDTDIPDDKDIINAMVIASQNIVNTLKVLKE